MTRCFIWTIKIMLAVPCLIIAQEKHQPLQLRIQVNNTVDEQLFLIYQNEKGIEICDTFKRSGTGYYLRSDKVDGAHVAFVSGLNLSIYDLFIAPGYNLLVTGDGSSYQALLKSKRISGKGSHNNLYYRLLDSILQQRKSDQVYYQLPRDAGISYISSLRNLKDSLAEMLFFKSADIDTYSSRFGKIIGINNRFDQLRMILSYAERNGYDYAATRKLVDASFDISNENLYSDQFLVSDVYKEVMTGSYLKFLMTMPQTGNAVQTGPDKRLRVIAEYYQGALREYAIYEILRGNILYNAESAATLEAFANSLKEYERLLRDTTHVHELRSLIGRKSEELLASLKGKPSPLFQGVDLNDKHFTISDFKGKVVYIDLWASWCLPCREETPFLNELQKEYAGQYNMVFVGIAISDQMKSWKESLAKDKPAGIQLYDKDKKTFNMFLGRITIPRFFIIAKDGTIADFNAPRPSDKAGLKAALDAELNK